MATPYVGNHTAYDLTTGQMLEIDDSIYLLDDLDVPMLTGVGSDGFPVISSLPTAEIEFSWQVEETLTPRSNLSAAVTTAATFITVTPNERARFSTGDLIRVIKSGAGELMEVTGYGTTADTLTVARGYDTTEAVQYAGTEVIMGVGTLLPEFSAPENPRSRDRDLFSGNTQIFGPTSVAISRTMQGLSRYGVQSEASHQLMRRAQENAISREQAFIMGHLSNDTATKKRSTGSLNYYITANEDTQSTQITVAAILANQQAAYLQGGVPTVLMANPVCLAHLNAENDSRVRTVPTDTLRGVVPVTVVTTEFGDMSVVRDRWIPTTHAFGTVPEGVVERTFDPLIVERYAKTKDGAEWAMVTETGLAVKGQQHMWKMTALDYAAA